MSCFIYLCHVLYISVNFNTCCITIHLCSTKISIFVASSSLIFVLSTKIYVASTQEIYVASRFVSSSIFPITPCSEKLSSPAVACGCIYPTGSEIARHNNSQWCCLCESLKYIFAYCCMGLFGAVIYFSIESHTIASPGISTIQVVINPLTRGTLSMVSLFWLSFQLFFHFIIFWSVVSLLAIELQAHVVTHTQTPTASRMYTKPPLSRCHSGFTISCTPSNHATTRNLVGSK